MGKLAGWHLVPFHMARRRSRLVYQVCTNLSDFLGIGSTLNNSHNIFILNLNSIFFHYFSRSSFCIIIRLDLSYLSDFLHIKMNTCSCSTSHIFAPVDAVGVSHSPLTSENELKQAWRASTASNLLASSHISLCCQHTDSLFMEFCFHGI